MSDLGQKPFDIPKRLVWEAYRKVAANKGAAGVDGQSIAEFEEDLKGNLYKLWNRLSSGTYFPPPVRGVEIPKKAGGTRMLGVPTVADRIAQTVVCMVRSRRQSRYFTRIPTGTGPDGRRCMRWQKLVGAAGRTTGLSIWISGRSSILFPGIWFSER